MSDRFHEGQLAYAHRQSQGDAPEKHGIVFAVDNVKSLAKVKIQPEDIQTDWLAVKVPFASASVSMRVGLAAGMHVALSPQEKSSGGYVITGAFHNDTNPAPQGPSDIDGDDVDLAAEEVLIKTPNVTIRIDKDGNVLIMASSEVRLQAPTIRSKGDWQHDGDFTATGDVSDFHNTLDHLRQTHNGHHHGGVQGGSSNTAGPSQTD